jgi:hypothetical protein
MGNLVEKTAGSGCASSLGMPGLIAERMVRIQSCPAWRIVADRSGKKKTARAV